MILSHFSEFDVSYAKEALVFLKWKAIYVQSLIRGVWVQKGYPILGSACVLYLKLRLSSSTTISFRISEDINSINIFLQTSCPLKLRFQLDYPTVN